MSEELTIQESPTARTREGLAADLRKAGVRSGETLLVHCSLSALDVRRAGFGGSCPA